ncbi:MAG: DUF2442 domain-containing protein [Planctomycetota bacterium]|nr:DUF2442 domain-containing protein [Planctomycetota bacterium]
MSVNPTTAPRLLEVQAESDHKLRLRYEDGTVGVIDLSHEISTGGVFASLRDPAVFGAVRLGECGQVEWEAGADLCPHALYMRLTGKTADEVFPGLARQPTDA